MDQALRNLCRRSELVVVVALLFAQAPALASSASRAVIGACEASFVATQDKGAHGQDLETPSSSTSTKLDHEAVLADLVRMKLAIEEKRAKGETALAQSLYVEFSRARDRARTEGVNLGDLDTRVAEARSAKARQQEQDAWVHDPLQPVPRALKKQLPWVPRQTLPSLDLFGRGALAFRPNSTHWALYRGSKQIVFEDFLTEKRVGSVELSELISTRFKFSPDGSLLASYSYGAQSVRIDQIGRDGQVEGTFRAESKSAAITSLAFSSDSRWIAGGLRTSSIHIWDARSGKLERDLPGHSKEVYRVVFSPDHARLASVSEDKKVKVWDLKTGTELYTLAHANKVAELSFSGDNMLLVTRDLHHLIQVWNAKTGEKFYEIKDRYEARLSPDGSQLLVAHNSPFVAELYDAKTGRLIRQLNRQLTTPDAQPTHAEFSHDGSLIITITRGGSLMVWDGVSGEYLTEIADHDRQSIQEVMFSPNDRFLAVKYVDGQYRLFEQGAK